ncbi:MAG: serine/threonine-protein kinase [Archangium sp.]|nr:serine/threonine-protein kinase [Archangium sp.]
MTEATSLLAPGVVVAETYEIERQLGRGGMGEVWLARHRRLAGKQVAIKILHVDRQLPQEALARFKREAEIAARLEHPNIVQVLDFNPRPTGQPYLVMEFLKGQSLSARARGKTLDLPQVAGIMRQVGAALQAAHRAGVVHRDLKPENIFVIPTAVGDQVKVLDFGISKLSDSNTVQTTDSVLIGTPLYMSPEQALGHNSDVTPQSDLFSLGTICYELFTGQPPFTADNIAKVVFRIAYEKHAPLSAARPDLPPGAVAAVEHALEKERERRTKDIDAFVLELTGQALNEVVQDESSGVYSPGMQVTDSMGSGETRAPSGGAPKLATPSPGSAASGPGGPPPGNVKTVSGKKVMIALVGGALILSAVVAKVRTDNWAERSAYRAGMIDAGHQLLADGTFLMDAGAATVTVEVPDAGVPDAAVAALVVVDAGAAVAVAVEPPKPKVPPTPVEQRLLDSLAKLEHQEKWDAIFEARATLRAALKTPSAREQGLLVLINATCARADNAQLLPIVNEYKAVATAAQVRAARLRCIKHYPSAEFLDW